MGQGGYIQINKALDISVFESFLETQHAQLQKLENVQQLSPRVIRILGQNPGKVLHEDLHPTLRLRQVFQRSLTRMAASKFTLQGTNTYIVGTGKRRLIIDTGQGIREWADLVETTLDKHGIGLSHIMLTHWHGDHTGGVPDLLRMFPDLSDRVFKHSPSEGQRPIADGETFRVEGATVLAVHGQGHSHDHVCFVLEEENAMFTGDNILGHGTSAVEHLGLYMQTLEKLKAKGCAVGYPAHGDVIPDLGAKITQELTAKTRREQRCLNALRKLKSERAGGMEGLASFTVKELVLAMHGSQLDDVTREKALEPFVDEVLRKLTKDGKVAFHSRGGTRRWFLLS